VVGTEGIKDLLKQIQTSIIETNIEQIKMMVICIVVHKGKRDTTTCLTVKEVTTVIKAIIFKTKGIKVIVKVSITKHIEVKTTKIAKVHM
jgi:hypothetical protein